MFFEFFILWGFWWWILFAGFVIADILFLEYDNGRGATFSLFVFAAAMFFLGDWNPFPWMIANPLWTVGVVLGYFVAGSIWSMVKWYFHCLNVRDDFKEFKDEFFTKHGITGEKIPMTLKKEWEHDIIYTKFRKGVPLNFMDYKGTILTWMTHWPFSAVWTLLNDPIRRIFLSIYKHLGGILQSISNRCFATVVVEFDEGDDDDSGQPSGKGWQRS